MAADEGTIDGLVESHPQAAGLGVTAAVEEAVEPELTLPGARELLAPFTQEALGVDQAQGLGQRPIDAVEAEDLGRLEVAPGGHRLVAQHGRPRLVDPRDLPAVPRQVAALAGEGLDDDPLEDQEGRRAVGRGALGEGLEHGRRHAHDGQVPNPPHPRRHPGRDLVRQPIRQRSQPERIDPPLGPELGVGFGDEREAETGDHDSAQELAGCYSLVLSEPVTSRRYTCRANRRIMRRVLTFPRELGAKLDEAGNRLHRSLLAAGHSFPPSPRPQTGPFEVVILPDERPGWQLALRAEEFGCTVHCSGAREQIRQLFVQFDSSAVQDEPWLEQEECEQLESIVRLVLGSVVWQKSTNPQDILQMSLSWLMKSGREGCLPLAAWLEREVLSLVDWHWVWLELPLYGDDYPDLEGARHRIASGVHVRDLTGIEACRLLSRARQRAKVDGDQAWRNWAQTMGLPSEISESRKSFQELLEASRGPAINILERSPRTEEEHLSFVLQEAFAVFTTILRFGSMGKCVDEARRIHSKIAPLASLYSSAASSIGGEWQSPVGAISGRSGFIVPRLSRIPVRLSHAREVLGQEIRRHRHLAEPGEDLSEVAWGEIANVIQGSREDLAFDHAVLLASTLFSRAIAEESFEARVVFLLGATEVLFERQSKSGVRGRNLRERRERVRRRFSSAVVAAVPADASRQIDAFYDLRNSVVHEGHEVSVADEEVMAGFQRSLGDVLRRVLQEKSRFGTIEAFHEWLDEKAEQQEHPMDGNRGPVRWQN